MRIPPFPAAWVQDSILQECLGADTIHALFVPFFDLIDADRTYSFLSHEFESQVWILSLEFES